MKNTFGPWATAIHPGNNPQLSTFWKRRLTMLPEVQQAGEVSRREILLSLGGFGLALLLWPTLFVDDKVQAQNTNPNRLAENQVGNISDAQLPENPSVEWEFHSVYENRLQTIVLGMSDVTISDGIAYFGDGFGRLYARRAVDGSPVWKHEHGKSIGHRIYTAPHVHDKAVYFSSRYGIAAVSRLSGTEIWKYEIRPIGAVGANVVVVDETLFVGGTDGSIHALDAESGTVRWIKDIVKDAPPDPEGFSGERARFSGMRARPTGAASDGRLLFQCIFDQSRIVALNCKTGELQWSFQAEGWLGGRPAITDQYVFIGSQDNQMYCLKKETGKVLWKFGTGSRVEAGSSIHNGSVYFGSCDGNLYCIDIQSGKLHWKFRSDNRNEDRPSPIYSIPIITDKSVYFAAGEGHVYSVDLATGKLLWKFRPSEHSELFSSLATDGKRLFVKSRPNSKDQGEHAIFAIGEKSDR